MAWVVEIISIAAAQRLRYQMLAWTNIHQQCSDSTMEAHPTKEQSVLLIFQVFSPPTPTHVSLPWKGYCVLL